MQRCAVASCFWPRQATLDAGLLAGCARMNRTCFFTIVSNNYRHFARALVASVRQHSSQLDAFVAVCDDPLPTPDPSLGCEEIPIRELGLPKFDRFTFQYSILELNTAVKPWVIETLFDRGYERVVYFDPDIKLYGPAAPIVASLELADILLTPHLTGQLDDGKHPSELSILQSGSYNLGFIAMRQTKGTRRMLDWWQKKLLRDCVVDIERGLFTDQKWIDLVPGMFDRVHIERNPGWNVAYWNLNHRHVVMHNGAYQVNGHPLLFFHFSGFSPDAKLLSKHQNRYTMETLPPAVRELTRDYAAELQRAGYEAYRQVPYAFGRFLGGDPIPDLARRCYREGFPWEQAHPDLWTAAGQSFLLGWLNGVAPEHNRSPWLTRLAATFYRFRPDLQAAFPDVVGAHGLAYAHWFVENAAEQAKLPDLFLAPVRAALASARAGAVGSAAKTLPRLSGALPDSTPAQGVRRRLFQATYRAAWALRHAVKPWTSQAFRHRVRHGLLRRAYFDDRYVTPPLTAIPSPVPGSEASRRSYEPLKARAGGPGRADRRPGSIKLASPDADPSPIGINVIGYLAAESGVGESARASLRALKSGGIRHTALDYRVGNLSRMNEALPDELGTSQPYEINLFHINADQMFVVREALGASAFAGRYNIGYWAWELSEFPNAWVSAFDIVDEVWVPSAFCQQAIAEKSPVPVLRMPHSVAAPLIRPDRIRFGLAQDEIVFLGMCDVLSVPERKNPLGVALAFARAFATGESVKLVLKINNLEHQPDILSRLKELAAADSRISLVEGYLSRSDLWTLLASVDCFVSLHRSEGFGLVMAEAMACGRCVIATGWSGNLDFTRPDNSLLVDYRLVELERDLGPYQRGQRWAEPDIACAAQRMRQVAASAELRERLGNRARETIEQELSPAAIAQRLATRVAAIARRRKPFSPRD